METVPAQGFLELEDADFYAEPVLSFDLKIRIMESEPGIYLDGPGEASADEHAAITYLGSRVTRGREHLRVDLRDKASILVTRVEDDTCEVTWAFRGEHAPSSIVLARPDPDPRADVAAEHFEIDTEARLEHGLGPGSYRAWILLFDERSNPVTTRLTRPESGDPEVAEFLKTYHRPTYAGPVMPPEGDLLPRYRETDHSLPVPDAPGVVFAVPRITVGEEQERLVLHGSFRLPIKERHLAAPMTPEEKDERDRAEERGRRLPPRPTAVVPVTLVLGGATDSAPYLVRLFLPSFDPVDPAKVEETPVTGVFELDLRRHAELTYQTYAVWALAGGELYGPVLAALVDPAQLPAPGE